MRSPGRSVGTRGMTLVEIAISIALMSFSALLLMATLTSSRQADSLSFERSLANNAIPGASVQIVPVQITMSWQTGSNTRFSTTQGDKGRQRITIYAVFSPQH